MLARLEDFAGHRSRVSLFGDLITAARHDLVSGHFGSNLTSMAFQRVERWAASGGAGVLTLGEWVRGGTSGAIGILEDTASPIRIRVLYGAFQAGETITGVGTIAAASGATRVIAKTGGIGTSSVTDAVVTVNSGTMATTDIALEAATLAPYSPGHELGAFFTASWTAGDANTDAFIGLFNRGGYNGVGIGQKSGAFGVTHRYKGVDTFVPITSWYPGVEGGSFPARVAADVSNIRVWGILIGYLGVAGYDVVGLDSDKRMYVLHQASMIGQGNTLLFSDPHLTMRTELTRTASVGPAVEMRLGSWNAFTVGPTHGEGVRGRVQSYEQTITTSGTAETLVFALRNDSAPALGTNRAPLRLMGISVLGDGTTGVIRARVRKGCTLTGPTWVSADPVDSIASINTTGALGANVGRVVWYEAPATRDGRYVTILNDDPIEIDPGETLTFTVATTNNMNITVFIRWEEAI